MTLSAVPARPAAIVPAAARPGNRHDTPTETAALTTVVSPVTPASPGVPRRDFIGNAVGYGTIAGLIGLGMLVAPSRKSSPERSVSSGKAGQIQRAIYDAEKWTTKGIDGQTILSGICADGRTVHLREMVRPGSPKITEYAFQLKNGNTTVVNYEAKSPGGNMDEFKFAELTYKIASDISKRPR